MFLFYYIRLDKYDIDQMNEMWLFCDLMCLCFFFFFKDGQSLEGLTEGEETDMEDEDISLGLNSNEELVSVQGQDGQQYVVLEVIQLEV